MGLSGDHGRLIKWHQPDNFAFVEQSRTMKAPVGLLSERTVLRSKMEGLCPDKFQFAVLGSSRFWGRRSPTRALSKSNKCPNADPEQQRPKAGYHHGDGILPFVLYPPVLSWESVVYSSWFNKSEFERRKLMYPLISVFIIVVGALLLVFANKIIKNNKVNRIGIKVVGGILIIVGLLLLYFLLSGKLTLPLSK